MKPNHLRVAALACLLIASGMLAAVTTAHATQLARASGEPEWQPLEQLLVNRGHTVGHVYTSETVLDNVAAPVHGLIVPGGGTSLEPRQLDAIEAFVARGGHVLVLGHDGVAAALGTPFAGAPVHAADAQGHVPATAHLQGRSFTLALPDARPVLAAGEDVTVFATTANDTFLDADGDGRRSAGDATGPFPLAIQTAGGRVTVVGTPGLFTTASLDAAANRDFASSLLDAAFPQGATVLLDRAHHADAGGAWLRAPAAAAVTAADAPAIGVPVALLLIAAGALAAIAEVRSWQDAAHRRERLDDPVPREVRP